MSFRTSKTLLTLASMAVLGALTSYSHQAQACGGMFCDGGPQPMPVDQKGENILYAVDSTAQSVEAHIQIQYEGAAQRFAWVLPVQNLPTFEVGSQLLFDGLLAGSVPTYGRQNIFECNQNGGFGGASAGGPDSSNGGAAGSAGGGGGGPEIVFQKTVGAFDVTVLKGGSAKEVIDWLDANGYQQNPAAEPLLQAYLEKNYLFAALKLTGGAGVDEIHPLVVKYHGTQPCIPLTLTAIAATENMGVRAFFLGDKQWVPSGGYKHIVLNPARIDWSALGTNYLDVITKGADSAVANGKAFVTEYAGTSTVVQPGGIYNDLWSSEPFKTAKPEEVISLLSAEQLVSCFGGPNPCSYNHPLLKPLLEEFLPAPKGVSEDEFYGCLSCYSDQIDQLKWDGAKFAALFDERIAKPGQHAADLLAKWPYLTRMFTTISPAEMTSDPEFHAREGLADVAASRTGRQHNECKHTVMELPDQRKIALPQTGGWVPWTDEMPWVERIEELPETGEAIVLVDNTQKIDDLIDAWNKSQGWPEAGAGGASGAAGAGASDPGGSGGTAAGASAGASAGAGKGASAGSGSGASAGASGGAAAAPPAEPEGGGCQVGGVGSGGAGLSWAAGLVAFALGRRRAARGRVNPAKR